MATTMSGGLALRLAEAAMGFVGLGPVYFVADYAPVDGLNDPYNVAFFPTEQEAQTNQQGRIAPSAVFGPYETALTIQAVGSQLPVLGFEATFIPPTLVATFPGNMFDTLFCTASSVQKFAMPYYTYLYSPKFAQQVLEAFQSAPYAFMGHLPWSEYDEIGPGNLTDVVEPGAGNHEGVNHVPAFLYLENGNLVWKAFTPHGVRDLT
jgi:hypothetical protein